MIFESAPWKNRVLKFAERLTRRTKQKKYSDRTYELIEEEVFYSSYAIRKLIEASKLSQSTIDFKFPVVTYPPTGKNVSKMNFHNLDELYRMDVPRSLDKDLTFIINQIIHSYVFTLGFDSDSKLDSFLVSSDFERNKSLYHIQIMDYIWLLNRVGHDYPNMSFSYFDETLKDYRVWQEMLEGDEQREALERILQDSYGLQKRTPPSQ